MSAAAKVHVVYYRSVHETCILLYDATFRRTGDVAFSTCGAVLEQLVELVVLNRGHPRLRRPSPKPANKHPFHHARAACTAT